MAKVKQLTVALENRPEGMTVEDNLMMGAFPPAFRSRVANVYTACSPG